MVGGLTLAACGVGDEDFLWLWPCSQEEEPFEEVDKCLNVEEE